MNTNPRFQATAEIAQRFLPPRAKKESVAFAQEAFHPSMVEHLMSKDVHQRWLQIREGKAVCDILFADAIADVMKSWAMDKGATHFCHWFQPLTGLVAEKQDAFFDWAGEGVLIAQLSGKQLLRGEPDASSFPSGGLRCTAEARGYTAWDPTSFPFLWDVGGDKVLCLPSIFFSWNGHALDFKIPLLRSEARIGQAALRLLQLFDIDARYVFPTLGCEQEFFLIDRSYYLLRPDLQLSGRTICGTISPKGQELEDHYFATLKMRITRFFSDLEEHAFSLGIPLKTRHAEVAPCQFEVAPLFEKASLAVDHNVLLMELLRQTAERHHLACLLHEKPFAHLNGSGKHCNWSLLSDTGVNLLAPQPFPFLFLVTLTAILHAVYENAALLRASIAVPGNDHRLGGHEAPPPILSVYLGEALERWLAQVEKESTQTTEENKLLQLSLPAFAELHLDATDRNRTSPFAFTGNKFEFRAVGASQNCALPITVLNVIVAESLHVMIDAIEKAVMQGEPLEQASLRTVRAFLKQTKPIRFSGDNYSAAWLKEAKKRKLPIIARAAYAWEAFLTPRAVQIFEGVLSKKELEARIEVMSDKYCKVVDIESRLLHEMFFTQLLPPLLEYQKEIAQSVQIACNVGGSTLTAQKALLKRLSSQIETGIKWSELLEKERQRAAQVPLAVRGVHFSEKVEPQLERLRKTIDLLEMIGDDRLFPLPKYREMLHLL